MAKEVTAAQVADKVVDKTDALITSIADKASNFFEAAANLVGKGIDQYGQQAIDAVLWVVRIDAIQTLVVAWMFVLASIIIPVIIWKKVFRPWILTDKEKVESGGRVDHTDKIFTGAIVFTISTIMFLSNVGAVTNVWNYVAIYKPELYLVKKTIDAVEKKISKSDKK